MRGPAFMLYLIDRVTIYYVDPRLSNRYMSEKYIIIDKFQL